MSEISDHVVYKRLEKIRAATPLGINMRESNNLCFIDNTSTARQVDKRIFKYNEGLFTEVYTESEAYTFRPSLGYLDRRAIPFNISKLKGVAQDQVMDFLEKYFTQGSVYHIKDNWDSLGGLSYKQQHTDHMADAARYTTEYVATNGGIWIDTNSNQAFELNDCKINPNEREKETMLNTLMRTNKEAVASTANMVAAKTISDLVLDRVTPMLPEGIQPFAETPLGGLVFANIAVAVLEVAGDNLDARTHRRAKKLTEAMLVSSMTALVSQVDIPGLIKGVLNAPGLADLVSDEDGCE